MPPLIIKAKSGTLLVTLLIPIDFSPVPLASSRVTHVPRPQVARFRLQAW